MGRRRASVLVGAGIVASRFVVAEVPPLTLTMLRYAIGFACLLPFACPRCRARWPCCAPETPSR
ncbi:MAG: hypothetical protein JWP65_20 [Ramlibacter sp.]|uniref:hypothetical protein n=1 Tax=Ramlibacter sp. TaxID=1917967 RepID=UPI0026120FC7|nr:hypothetical protein [Ramlibacter sp.]MDB5749599.1 hypothetical protein [Ramlibacter sp.]